MATFAPSQQPPTSRPLPVDFTPSSPPDRPLYAMHNGPPEPIQTSVNGNNRVQHRQSTDFKANGQASGFANGSGGMPVPNGMQHHLPNGGSRHRGTVSMGAFDGPRSPPSTKSISILSLVWDSQGQKLTCPRTDTSHVPCKFFRTGQCQAGKACPFSHSTDISTIDTPCKYFAKVCKKSTGLTQPQRYGRFIDSSRVIVNLVRNAHWHTSFPMAEESIGHNHKWPAHST